MRTKAQRSRRSSLRSGVSTLLAGVMLAAVAVAGGLVTTGDTAAAAPIDTGQPTWQCTPNTAVLVRGSNPPANQGIPATINYAGAPFTFNDLTGPVGFPYNAIGWDIESRYIFGLGNVNDNGTPAPHANHLVQLAANGTVVDLGIPIEVGTGTPLTAELNAVGTVLRWTIGAMDDSGNLYATNGAADNLYKIDVSAGTYTKVPFIFPVGMGGIGVEDWGFNPINGLLYGMVDGASPALINVDATTGQVTRIPQSPAVTGGVFGATWFSPSGILYGYQNATGRLYRVTDLTSTGHYELVSSGNPTAGFFDGAACGFGAALHKDVHTAATDPDGKPYSERGEVVTYDFEITWNGDVHAGVNVADTFALPGTFVAGSVKVNGAAVADNAVLGGTASDVIGDLAGEYAGTNQIAFWGMTVPRGVTTISIDVAIDPAAPHGDYVNQATLSGLPTGFADVPSDYPDTPLPGDPTPLRIRPLTVVTIGKVVLDEQGLNPQPGTGWTVEAAAVQADGTTPDTTMAGSPIGSQLTTQLQPGDPATATWTFRYLYANAASSFRLRVAETMQTGYEFVSGSCVITPPSGPPTTVAVTSVSQVISPAILGDENVACTFTNKQTSGTITWTKVDDQTPANPLSGSEWTLTGPAGAGSAVVAVADCTSAPCAGPDVDPVAGAFRIDGLAWGEYELVETAAPAGYHPDATVRALTVDASHLTVDAGAIVNTPVSGSVRWQKVDGAGNDLALSQWQISGTATIGGAAVSVDVTDNTGQAGYTGVDTDIRPGWFAVESVGAGTYSLAETAAPPGYLLVTGTHAFTISAGAPNHVFTLPFVNQPRAAPTLPLTGGVGRDFYLMLGGGAIVVGIVASFFLSLHGRRRC
ncbi:DUF6923 family protein, partial [Microbacterium sp.]|uniref:DUF6923 family protein n=1 Tax=Microbacterium sp. TaxID=51671 RepID=UPI003A8AA8CE